MAFSFNGVTKIITLSSGTTSFDVKDLWSRWVDWQKLSDNSKYLPAFSQLGGDDIDQTNGISVPIYIFVKNGWKIKPQEANHTLSVTGGVLVVDGGGDPFADTTGSYNVRIVYQQPVQAITVATGGGGGSAPTVDQIWQRVIENGVTAEQMLRLLAAVSLANAAGLNGPAVVFRDLADTKDRIVATITEGERAIISVDAT